MESFHKIHDDLEKAIEKDETSNTLTNSDCEETLQHVPLTVRHRLDVVIHSRQFQIAVVVLVIVDVLFVVAQLLFDLQILVVQGEHHYIAPTVLHFCSLGILSLFIIELVVRLFVMRLAFFKHKLEIFDAVVVIVSFVLDIVFRSHTDASAGVGLIVILRLWRVTRIVNGIVISVRRQAEKKIEKERQLRQACEQELAKFRTYCTSLESEIESLYRLLKQNGIQYSEKIERRPVSSQISVVAEVNCTPGSDSDLNGTKTNGAAAFEKDGAVKENTEATSATY